MSDKNGRGGVGRGRGMRRDKSSTRPGSDDAASTTATAASVPAARSVDAKTTSSGGSGGVEAITAEVSSIALSVASKSSTSPPESEAESNFSDTLAKRPNYGTIGRQIKLRTNNFVVNFDGVANVHHYHVDITSEYKKLRKDDCLIIFWHAAHSLKLVDEPYTTIYDGGGNCVSLHSLNLDGKKEYKATVDCEVPRFGRKSKYLLEIQSLGRKKISFYDPNSKQLSLIVLDLVYRQFFNMPAQYHERSNQALATKFSCFGRSFFFEPVQGERTGFDLDAGRQVWGGYFFGAKIGANMTPIVNIDVANSVFIKKQSVLQFMCDVLNQWCNAHRYTMEQLQTLPSNFKGLGEPEVQAFHKAIKGFSVTTKTMPDRLQKVFSVTLKPASEMEFEWTQGAEKKRLTVVAYFAERHKIQLRYPIFPCLEVGSKNRYSYLPLEVCDMHTPQRVAGKLTDIQTSTMIKGVCTDAVERQNRIMDVIKRASLTEDPFARKFGFQIDMKMMETMGRMINAPTMEYFNSQHIFPREGAWMQGQAKFYVPATINCYGVVSFIDRRAQNELQEFCGLLMDTASRMGVRVNAPNLMPAAVCYAHGVENVHSALTACISDCGAKGQACELILVLMQQKNTEIYSAVKSIAEKELGISTQCVIQRNIRQPKRQTCENICLKINAKLGGVNCKLLADEVSTKYLLNQGTLILGLDVTHPAPTDRKAPSIGAAIGNIDTLPGRFGASVSVQKHRREAVVYLAEAIQKRVEAFYRQTQRKPERIIVYRDGVAEGQFREVLTEEMKSIRKACANIGGGDISPKITFIVVQKRHHTRFFCVEQRDTCGRGKNIPPGTVVDSVITHPSQFDFFLCSHFGIQGTSRPTHYHVLMDENNFTQEEMQAITFNMCHLYFRCNRSVSIPAPTYYAHLACARARHHLHNILGDATSDMASTTGSSSSAGSEEELRKAVNVAESMINKMYFC